MQLEYAVRSALGLAGHLARFKWLPGDGAGVSGDYTRIKVADRPVGLTQPPGLLGVGKNDL